MKSVLKFLRNLSRHNDKEWFLLHKDEYLSAKARFEVFTAQMIESVRSFDPSIGPMSVGDCTYRIYRDVRFSKDKSPYKNHMDFFICPGGKKSWHGGYYFHIGGDGQHMFGVGTPVLSPSALRTIREDIQMSNGGYREILSKVDSHLNIDTNYAGKLKKVPKGFPEGTPDSEFYKQKDFLLSCYPDEEFILGPDLSERLADILRTGKPFLDFINRAIDFSL